MSVHPAGPARIAAAAVLGVALTGCSFSVGTGTEVSQTDLESQVADMITGDDADQADVTCAGSLAAEVGATQDCLVTLADGTTGIRFDVNAIDGADLDYDSTIFVRPDDVASTIAAAVEDQGFPVESVECPDELIGEEGETTECTVVEKSGETPVVATVTGVDGLIVNFSFEPVSES